MKLLIPALLVFTAAGANAQLPKSDYPSCDLAAQHAIAGETGGSITDRRQAHISSRADVLQADIATARKARHLTQAKAGMLFKRVDLVRRNTNTYTRKQGFLSAAERASYDRTLDAVAVQLCGSGSARTHNATKVKAGT